jgi:hypothetical protein
MRSIVRRASHFYQLNQKFLAELTRVQEKWQELLHPIRKELEESLLPIAQMISFHFFESDPGSKIEFSPDGATCSYLTPSGRVLFTFPTEWAEKDEAALMQLILTLPRPMWDDTR